MCEIEMNRPYTVTFMGKAVESSVMSKFKKRLLFHGALSYSLGRLTVWLNEGTTGSRAEELINKGERFSRFCTNKGMESAHTTACVTADANTKRPSLLLNVKKRVIMMTRNFPQGSKCTAR